MDESLAELILVVNLAGFVAGAGFVVCNEGFGECLPFEDGGSNKGGEDCGPGAFRTSRYKDGTADGTRRVRSGPCCYHTSWNIKPMDRIHIRDGPRGLDPQWVDI